MKGRLKPGFIATVWVLLASFGAPVWSSEPDAASASGLKNLLGEQAAVEALEGKFEQSKYIADLDTTLDSSGDFTFGVDEGLHWTIRKPVLTQLRITPNEILELQDGEVVMRMDVDEQPMTRAISEVFFAIFGGDWQKLSERFTIRPIQEASPWRFELKPKGDILQSYLSSIELQGEDYLEVLILSESNGDETRIQLNDVKAR